MFERNEKFNNLLLSEDTFIYIIPFVPFKRRAAQEQKRLIY